MTPALAAVIISLSPLNGVAGRDPVVTAIDDARSIRSLVMSAGRTELDRPLATIDAER